MGGGKENGREHKIKVKVEEKKVGGETRMKMVLEKKGNEHFRLMRA